MGLFINSLKNNLKYRIKSEKRKLEIQLYSIEVENTQENNPQKEEKMSDNKMAHYVTMKKDMEKVIEYKNELEVLVEQQNTELERKGEELKELSGLLKSKENEIEQMSEYINNLEKHNKTSENKLLKNESRFKKLKKGKAGEMNKRIRDQQNEIELLRGMVNGSKKELKAKMLNIQTLKRKLESLEKINNLHLARHSDVQSIASGRNFKKGKDPFSKFEDENYSGGDKGGYYHSVDQDRQIDEARPDLEETEKYSKEQTAKFGNTFEPRKGMKITKGAEKIKNSSLAHKTPRYNLLKSTKSSKVTIFTYIKI